MVQSESKYYDHKSRHDKCLLHEVLLDQKFDTKLVGNIGNPILSSKNIKKKTIFVVEASSYQLEYSKIFKSRNIILELMEKRGYDIDDYTNRSINEIGQMLSNKQLDLLLEHNNDMVTVENIDGSTETRKKRCHIKYHLQGKVRINQIYEYLDDLYHIEEVLTKEDDFIIIVKDKPNDTLIKLMNNI